MFTRCTHCDALFRVTLHQLQSSSGQVRCGECLEVFDAFVHLTASEPGVPAVAEPTAPASDIAGIRSQAEFPINEALQGVADDSPAGALVPEPEPMPESVPMSEPEPEPEPERIAPPLPGRAESGVAEHVAPAGPTAPEPDDPAPAKGLDDEGFVFDHLDATLGPATSRIDDLDFRLEPAGGRDTPPLPGEPEAEALRPVADTPDPAPPDPEPAPSAAFPLSVEDIQPVRSRPRRRILSWALVFLLVVALPVQALVFLRTELARSIPALRPALVAACLPLGCKVPLPRLTDRLVIEASELQALDPTRPHRVVLIATIRNGAGLAQAYPHVELTLTDAREQVSGRKVFAPEEYLPPGTAVETGLAPEAEVDIRLNLDTGSVDANGYRLFVYHP